jgi:O-antigen/teichoic acid export membrane protein
VIENFIRHGATLVRLTVLARLLGPEGMGLFGICLLALAILGTFANAGFQQALVQRDESVEPYLDSVWSFNIARGFLLCLVLAATAPLIAAYFDAPRAVSMIRLLGLTEVIGGFTNVGIILFERDLDFKRRTVMRSAVELLSLIVGIVLAYILRAAWALVYTAIVATTTRVSMSFLLHGYRPKLRFHIGNIRELFRYGRWIMGSQIIIFFLNQGDDILVGGLLGAASLGIYQLAFRIARLPVSEVTTAMTQVLFPALSRIQRDRAEAGRLFLRVLQLTALCSLPLAVGIALFCDEFVMVFMKERWLPMVPLVRIFSVLGALVSLGAATGNTLKALGRPELVTRFQGIRLVVMLALLFPCTRYYGLEGAAVAVLVSEMSVSMMLLWGIGRVAHVGPGRVLRAVRLGFLSAALMGGIWWGIEALLLSSTSPAAVLGIGIAVCVALYALGVFGLAAMAKNDAIDDLRSILSGVIPAWKGGSRAAEF